MSGADTPTLIVSAVVVVGGIGLILFRRQLARLSDRVWSASSRPGSGPLILTNDRSLPRAGAFLIVAAAANAIWALIA